MSGAEQSKHAETRPGGTPPIQSKRIASGLPISGLQIYVLLSIAAIVPFAIALANGFAFDDKALILDNPVVLDPSPWSAWTTRFWPENESAGLYRPFTIFTYWLDAHIWSVRPFGFVLTNLLLNAFVTLLSFCLLRRLFPSQLGLAFFVAAIFGLHPLHSEAVVGIIGRSELLAALFGIAAYRLALDSGRSFGLLVGSGLCFLLSLLSKESGTSLWAIPVVHLIWNRFEQSVDGTAERSESRDGDTRWGGVLGVWSVALVFSLLARIRVLGSLFGLGQVGLIDNSLIHVGAWERIPTALGIQSYALGQTFFPIHLAADYSYPQIAPSTNWAIAGAVYLGLVLAVLLYGFKRQRMDVLWGWAFAFVSSVLTTNVFLPIGTVYGERLTYLPSLGWLWILGCLFTALPFRRPTLRISIGIVLTWMLALGIRSSVRATDWKDNLALFGSAVVASPHSSKSWNNYSAALAKLDRWDESRAAAETAVSLYPTYPAALNTLGTALNNTGDPAEAIRVLQPLAQSSAKRRGEAILEIGQAHILLQQGAAAESTFLVAKDLASLPAKDRYRWQIGLASSFAIQDRWSDARQAWGKVARENPDHLPIRQRFAYSLWKDGAPDSAEIVYSHLIADAPNDAEALNAMAWFLAKERRSLDDAVQWAEQAYTLQSDGNIADTWFEAVFQLQGCEGGREWLENAPLRPADRPALEEKWSRLCAGAPVTGESKVR